MNAASNEPDEEIQLPSDRGEREWERRECWTCGAIESLKTGLRHEPGCARKAEENRHDAELDARDAEDEAKRIAESKEFRPQVKLSEQQETYWMSGAYKEKRP